MGFNNFKAALSLHKILQEKKYTQNPTLTHDIVSMPVSDSNTDTGTGPGNIAIPEITTDSVPNSNSASASDAVLSSPASQRTTQFANILHDFNDSKDGSENELEEDAQSLNNSFEIEGKADDEEDDGEDDSSVCEGTISHKPGQRYTEFDFEFLEEEWLQPDEGSSDDISSSN